MSGNGLSTEAFIISMKVLFNSFKATPAPVYSHMIEDDRKKDNVQRGQGQGVMGVKTVF